MTQNLESLSVLCAGIRGGSHLSRHLDRAEAKYALGRCENRIRRSVESHGGHLVMRAGGKQMAFFNDSVKALQSAVEMQQRFSDLPHYSGHPLRALVGVCTGHQEKEKRFFPSEGINPAVRLSEEADPGHILFSIPKRNMDSPLFQTASNHEAVLALSCGNRQLGVFKMGWWERDSLALKMVFSQLGNAPDRRIDRLFLRHNETEIALDDDTPTLRIGRQSDCEIKLREPRGSRLHGTIERRLDRFVFVDRSSNGTFVTLEDQIEFFVHRKELVLFGNGQLRFGAMSSDGGAELLGFQTSCFP